MRGRNSQSYSSVRSLVHRPVRVRAVLRTRSEDKLGEMDGKARSGQARSPPYRPRGLRSSESGGSLTDYQLQSFGSARSFSDTILPTESPTKLEIDRTSFPKWHSCKEMLDQTRLETEMVDSKVMNWALFIHATARRMHIHNIIYCYWATRMQILCAP